MAPDLSLVTHTQGASIFFPLFAMLRDREEERGQTSNAARIKQSSDAYFPITFFHAAALNIFLRSKVTYAKTASKRKR